jgi:hypothetical protein
VSSVSLLPFSTSVKHCEYNVVSSGQITLGVSGLIEENFFVLVRASNALDLDQITRAQHHSLRQLILGLSIVVDMSAADTANLEIDTALI